VLVPKSLPLSIHWYTGAEPPLEGVAVKETLVPAQIVSPGMGAMLTLAGKSGLTIIVMELDVAGEPETHGALVLNTQVTTSPLLKPDEV
jgi:hypothetical protein